ncbi:MAG: VOC family protein [Bacteroidetes bacterium]|nr:VOC family protein [Bacteroidota bacterium]MBL0033584.1 VOC family protein [Bacteroidota bacterium]
MTHELTTCLWYDGKAKEAAEYYCSIFKDSKITSENPMVVTFEINGSKFMGLNGGPMFSFNEAVSFVVTCDTQEEIDMYWNKLIANGGNESMCGWLKDKYGMSWQIVPGSLGKLMSNPAKGERVMQALLKMKKLDLKVLEEA